MPSQPEAVTSAESLRLAEADTEAGSGAWRRWGPYLAERAWGTVREDYSASGDAWNSLTFEDSRSRAYRWNEDGMGGICDADQRICLALAFWNHQDPCIKERFFGLTNHEGNHGEDVKEYWWYLDSTPTHSWMSWRYHYPQARFPFEQLRTENARRSRDEPEYELVDTGIFDDNRFFVIEADYAKATPTDICIEIRITNPGPEAASIDVLPTVWFRNNWSWGDSDKARPVIRANDGRIVAEHALEGTWTAVFSGSPEILVCENETNREVCFGQPSSTRYPKDGINDHVVSGAATVNPEGIGTKAAARHRLVIAPGATERVRLRFSDSAAADLGLGFDMVMRERRMEADAFYAAVTPADTTADEVMVMRQAFAGMLWSKQFYHYDVQRWLNGDPSAPPPPEGRGDVRNGDWGPLHALDVISMPDTWEYPWFAAWDLAFHCVALAHVDPGFAKRQLILLCREWYMHPNGQLPAYEWSFDDANPPVHAWAALRVFEIDGSEDYDFLERLFHKLLINFTWWVNRKDAEGNNVFEGGFLGLDNIGAFDRSKLPAGVGHLEQSDGTAWMAMYCLNLLELALVLAGHDLTYEDVATKFFEHFAYIAVAMDRQGLWHEEDGYYYDVLHLADGEHVPIRAHSIVGLIALCGVTVLEPGVAASLPHFSRRLEWFLANKPEFERVISHVHGRGKTRRHLFSIVDPDRLRRILSRVLSEGDLLSPYGLRALSQSHRDTPLIISVGGAEAHLEYEPGESRTALFGGNSNWRGPVWFPVNYLVVEALRRFHSFLGDDYTVEHPAGSGTQMHLDDVAADLARRLTSIFTRDDAGRRAVFGDVPLFQDDPLWRDLVPFHEYFHGDNGKGLGASHQTGWTGLVADLIASRERTTELPPRAASRVHRGPL